MTASVITEIIAKEMITACINVLSHHLTQENDKNSEKFKPVVSSRI
jgi:hypothetical protein